MEIVAIQLTESARSVLNMSFVSSENETHRKLYTMTHKVMDGTPGVLLQHSQKDDYWLPMTSIAWCRVKEKPAAKRGRPRKQVQSEAAA
jgi:hypothetical protein